MENVEEREFKSFFKDVNDGNESRRCNYTTRLDTYGCGCAHDCRYCYAKSLLSFRGLWKPNNPAVSDINEIRKTIKKELHPHEIVRLGGMTDCFQPSEREHRFGKCYVNFTRNSSNSHRTIAEVCKEYNEKENQRLGQNII